MRICLIDSVFREFSCLKHLHKGVRAPLCTHCACLRATSA
nr:MAG TPA: hypothetical protein [Caudoviricetes sp.]